MHKLPTYVVPAFVCMITSSQTMAGKTLSKDEINALVTGKTIESKHLVRDFSFKVYFDTDGETAYRALPNGNIKQTSYSINGNKHCLFWKGKNRCATIEDNGDGTYYRLTPDGRKIIKWLSVTDGKNL